MAWTSTGAGRCLAGRRAVPHPHGRHAPGMQAPAGSHRGVSHARRAQRVDRMHHGRRRRGARHPRQGPGRPHPHHEHSSQEDLIPLGQQADLHGLFVPECSTRALPGRSYARPGHPRRACRQVVEAFFRAGRRLQGSSHCSDPRPDRQPHIRGRIVTRGRRGRSTVEGDVHDMRTTLGSMRRTTAAALLAGAAVVALADSGEAQLAPSPWPMFQHDAFHSGRSPLLGPVFNGTTPPPGAVTSAAFIDKIKMHPVIGKDGTIYVGMGWQFCAVNPDLTPKWQGYSASAPGCKRLIGDVSGNAAAIDANGFVYLGDRDNTFYKFHPDTGAIIWTYNNGHEGDIASGPVIVSDGAGSANIYFTFIQNFTGYRVLAKIKQNDLAGPAPNLKWSVAVGQFGTTSSPVVGPNGVI